MSKTWTNPISAAISKQATGPAEPVQVQVSYWASRRRISACVKMSIRCPMQSLPQGSRTIRPLHQDE